MSDLNVLWARQGIEWLGKDPCHIVSKGIVSPHQAQRMERGVWPSFLPGCWGWRVTQSIHTDRQTAIHVGLCRVPTARPVFKWYGDLPVMENVDYYRTDLEKNLDLPEVGQGQEHSKEGLQDEWRLIVRKVLCGSQNRQLGHVRESRAISLGEGEQGYRATYFGLCTVEDGKPE